MKGKTTNSKLKTLHRLAVALDVTEYYRRFIMTVSKLLDFSEINEIFFEDE